MKMIKSKVKSPKSKGFTLLFASLIVALLLAIGLAILNIVFQQLLLSSTAKESKVAFYNADSGLECALYYEYNGPKQFATSSESDPDNNPDIYQGPDIDCGDTLFASGVGVETSSDAATTTFKFIVNSNQCPAGANQDASYIVKLAKYSAAIPNCPFGQNCPPIQKTRIESRGYSSCNKADLRRVERGLKADF